MQSAPLQEAGLPQLLCSLTFSTAFAALGSFLAFLSAVSAQPLSVNPGLWLLLALSPPRVTLSRTHSRARSDPKAAKPQELVEDEGLVRASCPRCGFCFCHHFFNKSGQGLAGEKELEAVVWVFCC